MSKTDAPHIDFRQIVLFIALLIGSGVFSTMLTKTPEIQGNRAQVSALAQMVLAAGSGIALVLIASSWRSLRNIQPITLALWLALTGWVLVSVVAGQLNASTFARFAGFVGNTALGFALFVVAPKPQNMLRQLCWVSAVIMAINLLYIPTPQLTDWTSRIISGTFVQFNVLGMTSAVAIIASATVLLTEKSLTIRITASLTLVTSAWLLSLTRSMTSTLMLLIMGISFLSVMAWQRYRPRPALIFAVLSIVAVFVFSFRQQFFSLIGKDATLTGRTKIWSEYADHIIQQPILGYGYGSLPANPSVLMQLEAHNGYIQLAYYTGGIGLFIFFGLLCRTLLQATTQTLQPNPPRYAVFFLSYLIAYVAINISEVYTLSRSLLVWPLFVYITLYMSQRNKLPESHIA